MIKDKVIESEENIYNCDKELIKIFIDRIKDV